MTAQEHAVGRDEPNGASDTSTVPLSEVLARLDLGLVSPVGAVEPRAVQVASIGIYEPGDGSVTPNVALIAPGFDASRADAAAAIEAVVDRGATCLFVKGSEPAGDVRDAAAAAGICLVRVDQRLSWERLFVLASTALASAERATTPTGDRHEQLGDLFALADAIAMAVDANTVIGDDDNRVLAFSNIGHPTDEWRRDTILGRTPPEEWLARFRADGVFDRLRQPGEVVHYDVPEEEGFRPRRAIGVHAAGRMIGSIAVVEGDVPFSDDTDATLVDAAAAAAIHLLRYESHHTLRQHARQDRLRRFLAGEEDARAAVLRLGLPTDGVLVTVVLAPRVAAAQADRALDRLGDFVRMRWPSGVTGVQVVFDGRLVLLLGGTSLRADEVARAVTEMVQGGSRLVGTELVAGIGRLTAVPEEIVRSREEADAVVDLLSDTELDIQVATLPDIWPHAALRQLETLVGTPEALQLGKASRLLRHDAEHDTEYADTLRIYLEELGDASSAADRLHIHPNTLRYRVKRAIELADIDLGDPADRLVAEIQLRGMRDRSSVPPT